MRKNLEDYCKKDAQIANEMLKSSLLSAETLTIFSEDSKSSNAQSLYISKLNDFEIFLSQEKLRIHQENGVRTKESNEKFELIERETQRLMDADIAALKLKYENEITFKKNEFEEANNKWLRQENQKLDALTIAHQLREQNADGEVEPKPVSISPVCEAISALNLKTNVVNVRESEIASRKEKENKKQTKLANQKKNRIIKKKSLVEGGGGSLENPWDYLFSEKVKKSVLHFGDQIHKILEKFDSSNPTKNDVKSVLYELFGGHLDFGDIDRFTENLNINKFIGIDSSQLMFELTALVSETDLGAVEINIPELFGIDEDLIKLFTKEMKQFVKDGLL